MLGKELSTIGAPKRARLAAQGASSRHPWERGESPLRNAPRQGAQVTTKPLVRLKVSLVQNAAALRYQT